MLAATASRSNGISARLRGAGPKAQIAKVWTSLVRTELPQLAALDDMALLDHLPEFLDGLASWVDGDTKTARSGFAALIEGHAVQRLQRGIDLATLTREYALLRSTIMHDLMSVGASETGRGELTRLHEGLDEAIHAAVRRYSQLRDEVRDRFVGILGHDLRTPLNAISLAAENLAFDPSDARRLAAIIQRSADRMTRMIVDVIEFARAQLGGRVPITLRPGDLAEVAHEAFDELRQAHPDRELRFETRGDLRGRWDSDRVLQVFSNLISNAIQHGRDPITVRAFEAADRRSLIFEVNDRGHVPADRLAQLFDPTRPETAQTRTGLGLGLYIVRQIALAHGAHCTVTSDSSGTTFRVVWPRALVS
jgi:signal transduction histidine kinase